MKYCFALLLGFLGSVWVMSAQAILLACTSPGAPSTTYSLASATDASCFDGNDTPSIDASFSLFGETGWTLADKNDSAVAGDGTIEFSTSPLNGTSSGTWAVSDTTGYAVVVTLKAARSYAAFLIDSMSGTWSVSRDLSHSSIYYRTTGTLPPVEPPIEPPTEPPVSVPEPGMASLLSLALIGSGLVTRRRRRV